MSNEHSLQHPKLQSEVSVRCSFRLLEASTEPPLYSGSTHDAGSAINQEFLQASRNPDLTIRLLAEINRKLDDVLTMMQKESFMEHFPHEGFCTYLSTAELVIECLEPLAPGDVLELLLFTREYPLMVLSGIVKVTSLTDTQARSSHRYTPYRLQFTRLDNVNEEALIAFLFQQERRRIREQKNIE